MVFTKPPPPPPKFAKQSPVASRDPLVTEVRPVYQRPDGSQYSLPMADKVTPAWQKVLKDCGYPTDVVVLDMESYFDSEYHMGGDGKALSTIEYVTDKRWEVLGLARLFISCPFPDYENTTHFEIGEEKTAAFLTYLQGRYGQNLGGCTVSCHNAAFDFSVLAHRYGVYPTYMVDTLALARHWNAREQNDLDSITKRFKLPAKGDTKEFSGVTLRQRFMIPKGRGKSKMPVFRPVATDDQIVVLSQYACNDVARQWELFTLLLPKLSNPKTELRLQHHTLELMTRPSLLVDSAFGTDLAKQYNDQIDLALAPTCQTLDEISGNISFDGLLSQALHDAGDSAAKYMKVCKKGMMLGIAKADDTRDELVKHPNQRVRELMNARTAIRSWPLHVARVQRIMRQAAANGGVLPVPLKYCGAHTGRWAGGERINLQNLSKEGILALIRQLLIAAPGSTLVIVDAAAIEARVLSWIAGQWDLVEKFQAGTEIYCDFATKVLGYPVRKAKKQGGIPSIEQRHTWARNKIGKVGILGCGYGMGTDKIIDYAGGAVDAATALKIRDTYRSENAAIVQFWKDIEKAFLYTAKYQRNCEMPRGLRFHFTDDCDVIITLPNGRELKYHRVKLVQDRYGDKAEVYNALEHKWEHLWGGVLTENVVQAMSRDVLGEAFLRGEDRGVHTAFHCHDEVVCPVPVEQAESALGVMIEELSRVPAWAPRMPLSAEGFISERYRK